MKIFRFLIIFALVVVALGAGQGAAVAGAFTYTSGIQVQNLEGALATVNLTFYNQNGSVAHTISSDTIPANGSKTYFPLPSEVGSSFNGSVIISADKQVAAISNILGDNGAAAASYGAATSGNTQVLLPLLMKNNSGYNTWFNVQNTHQTDAAAVTVNYSDGSSANASIQPGASHTFDQAQETHTQAVFSAIITSDKPVAAAVIEESTDVMFAYSGFSGGSTNPVLPLINANNSGYITGVQIQNSGNANTQVTLSYTPSGPGNGTACTETQTINAGASATFALHAFAGAPLAGMTTNCAGGQKFIGSAQVTTNSASQPLVAIINQLRPGVNGEAYGGFDPATAGRVVVLPLIMDRNSGYFTGFNVMNVGGSATSVNCTFTNTSYTVSGTLQPGQALNDIQLNKIADKYVGSATCTAGSGGQIVAVVNQLGANPAADQLLVYEGFRGPDPAP